MSGYRYRIAKLTRRYGAVLQATPGHYKIHVDAVYIVASSTPKDAGTTLKNVEKEINRAIARQRKT